MGVRREKGNKKEELLYVKSPSTKWLCNHFLIHHNLLKRHFNLQNSLEDIRPCPTVHVCVGVRASTRVSFCVSVCTAEVKANFPTQQSLAGEAGLSTQAADGPA